MIKAHVEKSVLFSSPPHDENKPPPLDDEEHYFMTKKKISTLCYCCCCCCCRDRETISVNCRRRLSIHASTKFNEFSAHAMWPTR